MKWYHWIACFFMCLGGIIFTIFPAKPLWLWGLSVLLVLIGVGMCFLPQGELTYEEMVGLPKKKDGA